LAAACQNQEFTTAAFVVFPGYILTIITFLNGSSDKHLPEVVWVVESDFEKSHISEGVGSLMTGM